MIMLPLSIYLTRRATADRGLMGDGNFIQRITEVFKFKKKEEKV